MEDIPYGYCQCGCGKKTNLAKQTVTQLGHIKGQPIRFIRGHRLSTDVTNLTEDGNKLCSQCHLAKPVEDFYWNTAKNKHEAECKSCTRLRRTERHYRATFGIEEEVVQELLRSQNNCCAICGIEFSRTNRQTRPALDHCHTTGTIRGFLCGHCNTALGLFRDSEENLSNAVLYLQRYKEG